MPDILSEDITFLQGVGPKRAALLNKLGVYTVADLLHLYPRGYIDLSHRTYFRQVADDSVKHAFDVVALTDPVKSMIRKNLTLYKFKVSDGHGDATVILYNEKYTAMKIHRGERYLLYGKVLDKNGLTLPSPQIMDIDIQSDIRPIYPQTAGLTSKTIEGIIKTAMTECSTQLFDVLPPGIRQEYKLCSFSSALKNIHFPKTMQSVDKAASRLIFEELFIWQLAMGRLKKSIKLQTGDVCKDDYSCEIIARLPFALTSAQQCAITQISEDMASGQCMNRLLQGDVGSGKTVVAVAAAYNAAKNGFQTAFMAPTELLAAQHFDTVSKLLEGTDIKIELLTGSVTAANKRRIYEGLKNGSIHIIIGTHALISSGVEYYNLGLVITDEQHRFGVAQRGELASRGNNAHLIAMSATPIPRTLALTLYGDLDVSVLDEKPAGRQKVDTYKIDSSIRQRAFNYIKKYLDEGRQAYIVCALVEENDTQLLAATDYYEKLRSKYFSDYRVGLLHGKMKSSEKERVMSDFAAGKIQLLVSTTVIEVGVDVPNAVIMMIENAERFGLSQLHQLRGRVGRGEHKSTCILVSDSKSSQTRQRLAVICRTDNGFEIASEDLKLRGPGDFFGNHQHGFLPFSIADAERDITTVQLSFDAAQKLLNKDPEMTEIEYAGIKKEVERIMRRFESA